MSDIDSKIIVELTKKIVTAANRAESETDLQTEVEHVLKNFFDKLGTEYEPHHNITIIRGRPDTLYGRAVIEYKIPRTLKSDSKRNAAVSEAQKNIEELVEKYHEDKSKYVGIILDGFQVTFTKFRQGKWITEPIMEVSEATVTRMLEYLRGLARKPLHPDFMVKDFGPDSELARISVQILYQQLGKAKVPRIKVIFDEWKKTFNQVCGYDFLSPKLDVKELVNAYKIPSKNVDLTELLFVIHTYYALVIKFLAAEITVTYASPFFRSFLDELLSLPSQQLREKLEELEEGGIFSELGIKNFLEGDFFAWYMDIWNSEIQKIIILIAKKLSEYEPATATLEPNEVRDLLKKLYQYLVPRKIRHDLGEFFTPDWLAELTLNEVGYSGNPAARLLDPACGSGTFLVLAIRHVREYAEDKILDRGDVLRKILDNIIGFDLNPLAVIAARTNYLIALGELIRFRKQDIFIPVYLSDSIAMTRPTQETLEGPIFEVSTSVGKFVVPATVVKEKLIDEVFSLADQSIKNHYEPKDFLERLKLAFKDLDDRSLPLIRNLYDNLLKLELKGVNRIWTRLIKNAFAPLFSGKFDFVVGNPPWINWEYLPEDYRNSTKPLWDDYGLLEKTKGMGLGKVKKDIAMLFVTRCFDQYVNKSGRLAFLIPFTVFKAQSGAGFRKLLANGIDRGNGRMPCKVLHIHDLVTLYPFEGAINRTSLLVIEKNSATKFPIPCVMWHNPKARGIDQEVALQEVKKTTSRFRMILTPITIGKPETSWMLTSPVVYESLKKVMKPSEYRAYAGSYTALNSAYWVKILSSQVGGILIQNLADIGDKHVKNVEVVVEADILYPLARGRDLKKWYVNPSVHIIVPHETKTGDPIPESGKESIKTKFPKTFAYFLKFKDLCEARAIHKLWGKDRPFYSLYDVGSYTFAPYKVAWKEIAGKISGKGSFSVAVMGLGDDKYVGQKCIVPDHKIMSISCHKQPEAYYIASLLNSSILQLIVTGYTIETTMDTHIINHVFVPKFNPSNNLHIELAKLSKHAHNTAELAYTRGDAKSFAELSELEEEIDKTAAKLYGITREELAQIKKTLAVLKGEVEKEDVET